MSSFRDLIIDELYVYYGEYIERTLSVLRNVVDIMNLYIEHQDKKYSKVFKEGVYCDLVYDESRNNLLPRVVFKSKNNESVELALTAIPDFSFYVDEDVFDELIEALYAYICVSDESIKLREERIYKSVLRDKKLYDGDVIDKTDFGHSLELAFANYLRDTPLEDIASMFVEKRSAYSPCYNTGIILNYIKNNKLYDCIFSLRAENVGILRELRSFDKDSIMLKVAIFKYSWFDSEFIIEDLKNDLKHMINTDYLLIGITKKDLKMVDLDYFLAFAKKDKYKGIVKIIHVLFSL